MITLEVLDTPLEILSRADIANPDDYLDELEVLSRDHPVMHARVCSVKELNHQQKVDWLLSLDTQAEEDLTPGRQQLTPEPGRAAHIYCLWVVTSFVVTFIIGYAIGKNGEKVPIKKTETKTKKVQKCQECGCPGGH